MNKNAASTGPKSAAERSSGRTGENYGAGY